MRILIATGYAGSWPYIPELIDELEQLGHEIVLLDTDQSGPCTLMQKAMYRLPTLRSLIPVMSLRAKLNAFSGTFDAVNIHYLSSIYLPLMKDFGKRTTNVISSIWGSELLRAKPEELQLLGQTLRKSKLITTNNPQVRARLVELFADVEPSIRVIPFGMRSPDVIRALQERETREQSREKLGIPIDRCTVTCGYNASQAQQHSKICRGLAQLPSDLKQRITVLLPMTYPEDPEYRKRIIDEFRNASIDLRVFDKKLSQEDICRLRIATDCTINIQTTDSLSASIQEHLICGSALIVGSWLPYDVFEGMGARITRVPSEYELSAAVQAYLNAPDLHRQSTELREKMYDFSCWKNSTRRWLDLYRGKYLSLADETAQEQRL